MSRRFILHDDKTDRNGVVLDGILARHSTATRAATQLRRPNQSETLGSCVDEDVFMHMHSFHGSGPPALFRLVGDHGARLA